MKIFRMISAFFMIIIITFSLANPAKLQSFASISPNASNNKIVNAAVLLYSFDDLFMDELKNDFEQIEKENKDKVHFTFYDGKNNITVQNETIDTLLRDNINLFIVNLADVRENIVEDIVTQVKQRSIPIVFTELATDVVSKVSKLYDKVAFTSTDSKEIGILQGEMISELWNTNRKIFDKNNDNVLQYILLQGEADNQTAIERSKNVISAINNSGIKTQQLTKINANWLKELAKESMEAVLLKYNGSIDAIISNNDAMAIGAIEALQKYGYNKGDKSKNIEVFGIDGLKEAKDLIDKGYMAGTIVQDPKYLAEGLYQIGISLVNNTNPLENKEYKLINNVFLIPMHREKYVSKTATL